MPDLKRDGLIQALQDLGVDMSYEGMDVDLTASLVIQLQDLSYNFEPAVRARAFLFQDTATPGAGLSNIVVIQAPSSGLWIRKVWQTAITAGGHRLVVTKNAGLAAGPGTPVGFNFVGSSPSEADITGSAVPTFPKAFRDTTAAIIPNEGALAFNNTHSFHENIWIPGLCFVSIATGAQNQAFGFGIDIQLPAIAGTSFIT